MNHSSEASFHSLGLISEPGGPKLCLLAAAELSSPLMGLDTQNTLDLLKKHYASRTNDPYGVITSTNTSSAQRESTESSHAPEAGICVAVRI
ncbi:hypothetical protein QQF64_031665 [Cirrhinus molitorella]|uniref:Uncharacterized protein n=1 Tax=Cirrhinus molitorella TaxID=172907 RepID=A0ABR3MXQ9_9TELE